MRLSHLLMDLNLGGLTSETCSQSEGRKDGKEGRVTEGEKEGKEREPAVSASPGNLLAVQILWP